MRERGDILGREATQIPPSNAEVEQALRIASHSNPLTCRERLLEFFRWQASTSPTAPLHLASRLLHDSALEETNALARIREIAESIVLSGFVREDVARECVFHAQKDLGGSNPISVAPCLLSAGLATVAYHTLHPLLTAGAIVVTGLKIRAYRDASWARHEYTTGYLQEIFDTHEALSRGEMPTIHGSIRKHFNWERNERFRADGYVVARTLRLLEVPSSEIHTAFATTASVELNNQPLVNLLIEKLNGIHIQMTGCLAADYLASHSKGGKLAQVLDALNECYFTWEKRTARLNQLKMIELLEKTS